MSALLMPKQGVELEVSSKNIMSVDIPVFTTHTKSQNTNDIYSYGYAYTKMTLTARYRFCRRALPDMLEGLPKARKRHTDSGGRNRKDAPPRECFGICYDPQIIRIP